MKLKNYIWHFICIVTTLTIKAQELPPIKTYTPQQYGAEDQNWSISQGQNATLYFANNEGLLEFNGARWQLYSSPNESILRSVKVVEDKIYTGCYMDFGYWVRDDYGTLKYTSLVSKKNINLIEDEQFWNIIALDNWVLFQSLNRIYIYNTKNESYSIINSETTLTKIYKVNKTIYFQKFKDGIYKIENGKDKLVTNTSIIKNKVIINIFEHNNKLLLLSKENGFYSVENETVVPWNLNPTALLSQKNIYSCIQLKNGDFVLGTVSNGIIHLDKNGAKKFKIKQSNGLNNNTVLSLFEDKLGNIWLGLDNGINTININSPFKVYNDQFSTLGTIYSSLINDNKLYLGTNQGLFFKTFNTEDSFKFIEGTEGQVWSLKTIDNTLFCGHDKGTFIINGNTSNQISSAPGTWQIKKVKDQPNLLIQGTYNGLYILERLGTKTWKLRNKIDGFGISSRYFEFVNNTEIIVKHEYKGIYKLKLDNALTKIISYTKDTIQKGIKSSLITYNTEILYAYKKGVFSYNKDNNTFTKNATLSQLYNESEYVSGKLINENSSNRLWGFSKNDISYIEPDQLSTNLKKYSIPLPTKVRKTKAGYENLIALDNENYLMGTTKGYIILDLKKMEQSKHTILLNKVISYELNHPSKTLNLRGGQTLKNKTNNILFQYSVADYNTFYTSEYTHRLVGFNDNWSNWSNEPEVLFENLPHGNYTFEIKARVGDLVTSNSVIYKFTIGAPWFLKPLAIGAYILGFIGLILLINRLDKSYYKKQREKLLEKKEKELEIKELENQKQLIQLSNKNLQQDIESKNRELGISTMNLIKRNELLNSIKKEINNAKELGDLKVVVRLINRNLNTTDDWRLFEEAFNNADKDFLKKIKTKHASLTPNDLRLCAYLKLNLSSKEIAPLLNISPKSVEVKRYRLRKKMNLSHDVNLANYILEV